MKLSPGRKRFEKETTASMGLSHRSLGLNLTNHRTALGDWEFMYSVWNRVNAVVFYGLTILLGLSILAAFTTKFHIYDVGEPVVTVNRLRSLNPRGRYDHALLSVDIDADLSPVFNWNVKQIFVFVVAEYKEKRRPVNQVVLWDRIVQSAEEANIHIEDTFNEYALAGRGNELRGTDVELKLMWDIMPHTGFLYLENGTHSSMTLPSSYSQRR